MFRLKRAVRSLFIVIGTVLCLPWFCSIGTYFSGYAHIQGENHEILLTAKSGFYKTIHIFDGQVYRVHSGIYASLGRSMYFVSLDGNYVDGLNPKFAEKVLAKDLEKYFRGPTHIRFSKQHDGKWIGKMKKGGNEYLFDEVVFNGRIMGW